MSPWIAVGVVATASLMLWAWQRARIKELTGRLRSEEAARAGAAEELARLAARADAQLLALLNSMTEGVLVLDAQARIQIANRAGSEMLGASGAIQGRTLLEATGMHNLQQLFEQALAEGHVRDVEIDPPGFGDRRLQVNASTLPDHDGKPGGLLIVLHDLTRLRQLENTRREFG